MWAEQPMGCEHVFKKKVVHEEHHDTAFLRSHDRPPPLRTTSRLLSMGSVTVAPHLRAIKLPQKPATVMHLNMSRKAQ